MFFRCDSSHMLDLSEESDDENIETCAKYFTRMAKMNQFLEMEIGITGGEEVSSSHSHCSFSELTVITPVCRMVLLAR